MRPAARAAGAKSVWDKDDAGGEGEGAEAARGAGVGCRVARAGQGGVGRGQEGEVGRGQEGGVGRGQEGGVDGAAAGGDSPRTSALVFPSGLRADTSNTGCPSPLIAYLGSFTTLRTATTN